MKNNKIIFLVAIVCCLAVCWFCFGAWTIADTDLTYDDFLYSNSTTRIYVVVSPNISSNDIANISFGYRLARTSSNTGSFVSLSSFTSTGSNVYLYEPSSYASGTSISLSIALSSLNTNAGTYFFTAAYIPASGNLYDIPSNYFYSNYVYYSFGSSADRTFVLFVDKLTTVSQAQYDELLQRYEDLEYDFSDLESDYDDLQIEVQEYIALYNQELAINTALNTRIEELQARIDTLESGGSALDFIGNAFEKVGDILQIEILPNITIGTIVAVPLILGVVFLVLRLVRGE